MADITLRLVWYRLVETYKSAVGVSEISTSGDSEAEHRRVDVLDMLFVGWLVAALVVIGAVNVYLRWFGRAGRHGTAATGSVGSGAPSGKLLDFGWNESRKGETVQWINAAVSWLSERQQSVMLVEAVLKALTEEAKKHKRSATDAQVRFERAERCDKASMTSSVEFNNVISSVTADNRLLISADVNVSDVLLAVSAVRSTVTNLHAVSCDVRLQRLTGTVQCLVSNKAMMSVTFQSPPELTFEVIPSVYDSVDKPFIESTVRQSIEACKLEISMPDGGLLPWQSPADRTTCTVPSVIPEEVKQPSDAEGLAAKAPEQVRASRRDRARRSDGALCLERGGSATMAGQGGLREHKVAVKVIKANGLMNKDFAGSCDPYCTVSLDEPPQTRNTSVVKNTINPFFDEDFVFNLNASTRQLLFEVYDRSKSQGSDEFLGRALITLDDLRRLPSTRQIIPLTGRTSSMTTTSGSITAEFQLMELPVDVVANGTYANNSDLANTASRHIETNQYVTPEGTLVTMTTTTTDRAAKDTSYQTGYNGLPIVVDKTRTVTTHPPQNSLYCGVELGGKQGYSNTNSLERNMQNNSIMEVALQELTSQQRQVGNQNKSTTITLSGKQRTSAVPSIKTTQVPYDLDGSSTLQPNASQSGLKDAQKKSSFANALKKRFGRSKDKKDRCQSVDRLGSFRSDTGDSTLLRPPDAREGGSTLRIADSLDTASVQRPSRSHSLSASFRNIFTRSKSKTPGGGLSNANSRESSVSRFDSRTPQDNSSGFSGSPHLRGLSPASDYSPRSGYPYSTSVPSRVSPLAQQ